MKNADENNAKQLTIKYYLQHIGDIRVMSELRKTDTELYNKIQRLHYIKSFQSTEPTHRCPKCHNSIVVDEWGEEYCPKCGLVTRGSYPYQAGFKFKFPYGLKI